MARYDIDVSINGPFFDARNPVAMAEFEKQAVDDVSAQTYSEVMQILNADIRHPTPYYETQIVNQRLAPGIRRVHDRGIVYGPWLEGVSARNDTTSFKGYHAFSRTKAIIQQKLPQLLMHSARELARRLGGAS